MIMARIIPKRLGIKLLILGACSLLLLIWLYVDGYCPFRRLIGIPCPTCGMSRAWLAAFRLDPASAFRFHPMFWSVPLLILFPLYDGRLFAREKLNGLVLFGLLAAYFVCYALRLVAYLRGEIVF